MGEQLRYREQAGHSTDLKDGLEQALEEESERQKGDRRGQEGQQAVERGAGGISGRQQVMMKRAGARSEPRQGSGLPAAHRAGWPSAKIDELKAGAKHLNDRLLHQSRTQATVPSSCTPATHRGLGEEQGPIAGKGGGGGEARKEEKVVCPSGDSSTGGAGGQG